MKRFLSMLMVFVLVLGFAACGNDEPVTDKNGDETPSGNGNLLGGEDEKDPELPETPEDESETFDQSYTDLIYLEFHIFTSFPT